MQTKVRVIIRIQMYERNSQEEQIKINAKTKLPHVKIQAKTIVKANIKREENA